ncbi:MAG: hypothetical protein M3075_01430 [Candidatus Dormibacteraeota bacterium]|jgi:hypothetical protein|nr:hypothetical protein [Candidatus Dormibacteraeota bacterium]
MYTEETLSRLRVARDGLGRCLEQLEAERNQAEVTSSWHNLLVRLIRHLETDEQLLAGLAERARAEMQRQK